MDGQRLIIYGGADDGVDVYFKPSDALYVLDVNNLTWYIPKTKGGNPSSRCYHQTNVIGKYMVVSFGKYDFFYC